MKFLDTYSSFFIGAVVFLALVIALVYFSSDQTQLSRLQASLWQNYKLRIWDSHSGRTINVQDNGVTTSEGQGYTMLRSVWENDPKTFAVTWGWTAKHLQRTDKLFSWRYGSQSDGSLGILTDQGGQNTASDADATIAFALLMAGTKWHNQTYLNAARDIVSQIWQIEVVTVQGQPYLAADNLEKTATTPTIVVNPSYLAPYAYRSFAVIDSRDNWQGLVASSYSLIRTASNASLDTRTSDGLPPDWIELDRLTGAIQAPGSPGQSTQFGYDAFRTVWQVALDWQWYHDPRAKQVLENFSYLYQQWSKNRKLAAIYDHNGRPAANYESNALYGGVLGYFQILYPADAKAIVQMKILPLYSPSSRQLKSPLNYYDNNWVWFGLALFENNLPNLAPKGSL